MEDILTMSQGELKRLHVIRKTIDKQIKQSDAAEILDLSRRQIRRLVKRIREESDKGIIHRSRGKISHNATAVSLKQRTLFLCRGIYAGFNPTFCSEKLFERNKIRLSRETLRQWFIAEGLSYDKRKARPHRKWRPRKAHCGQIVQMDGSHHDWFEGRRQPCVLMAYIDDATSRVYARFYEYEGTYPAMDSFKRYCLKYGLPLNIYLDRHSTYKGWRKTTMEEELSNQHPLSQFGRALEELGVHLIHAQSAPAKGRVERLFKTFQDRLAKEMRLRGLGTLAQGNDFLNHYLPVFNKRFGVEPQNAQDLHRPAPPVLELDKMLVIKTVRALRNDFTVVHGGRLYQIEENIRAKEVTVEERLNGSLVITYKHRALKYKEITQRPVKLSQPAKPRKTYIPPKDHPWRSFQLPGSLFVHKKEEAFAGVL